MAFKKETLFSVNNPVFGPVKVVSERVESVAGNSSGDRSIALIDGERKSIGNAVYNVRNDHVYIYNIGAQRKKVGVGTAISALIAHYEKKPVELVAESILNRKIFERMGYLYLGTVPLKKGNGYRMRLPVSSGSSSEELKRMFARMGVPKAD
ncbi:MAG: hypothetical protein WC408_03850 [Candidatus Micrarchaeia archaeon]|jgi:hypothetical protein